MRSVDIERSLGIRELRARVLEHTRLAFAMLPVMDRPRILDIGCGEGSPTLELARLSRGEVVGIDIDEAALSRLRERVQRSGLSDRITVRHASLFDSGLGDESFDILWEEGVLHLLDPSASFPECRRVLKPGGYLVMHEKLDWFEEVQEKLPGWGMALVDRHPLPRHFWWTHYGAPLEERIKEYRQAHSHAADPAGLARHVAEAAMIKANPGQFDCAFVILQKRDLS